MNNLMKILSLGEFEDSVKFTKLIFELQSKYKLFNYSFFRNDLGPDSEELQEDLLKLLHNGNIKKVIKNTSKGHIAVFSLNNTLTCDLDAEIIDYIQSYKQKSRKEILYSLYHRYDIFKYELGDLIFLK